MFVIPTLTVIASLCGMPGCEPLLADDQVLPWLRPQDCFALTRTFASRAASRLRFDHALKAVALLREAGVTILAGTDAPNPGTIHGASLHRELELLCQAGLTATEALRSATSLPARTFASNRIGCIQRGFRADLLLVAGDPGESIRATRAIRGVWIAGRRAGRDVYRSRVERAAQQFAAQASLPEPEGSKSGLISDFTRGELAANFGSGWTAFTDRQNGGHSSAVLQIVRQGIRSGDSALAIRGVIAPSLPYAWAGEIGRASCRERV